MNISAEDRHFMNRAVAIARNGAGWVSPNPMVGAVIVKEGRIIGEGYHAEFGGPHAEVNALKNASEDVAGATLYVTMEPCSHHGKTPPCTVPIIQNGIKRVVMGMKDPNPLVNGQGIKLLTDAGIEVATESPDIAIRQLNEIFSKYILKGLPFCTLKTAMTLDGKIATTGNASRWISGETSRKIVHDLRQQYSSLMVGINTVVFDNPLLTTRRKRRKSRNPLKIIVDSTGKLPLEARVLEVNPQLTILATTSKIEAGKKKEIERTGAHVLICPETDGRVDLTWLMSSLGRMGIDSVLLEGGSNLAFSALKSGVVDKVISFIAPKIIGGMLAPTPVGGEGIPTMESAIPVYDWKFRKTGADIMVEGYVDIKPVLSDHHA